MVVPLVAAGARVAAGAAARGVASRGAAAGAEQVGSRAVAAAGPKTVRNPFPVARRGDAPVPGKPGARNTGGWQQVKKRRDLKEMQRAIEEAQERDDLTNEEREALQMEQYRLDAIAEQEALSAQEEEMDAERSGTGSTSKAEHRVGGVAMFMMLAFAGIADALQFLLQFIPGVGQLIAWFLAFIAGAFFFMWFHLLGVGYFSGKKAFVKIATILVMSVVELVPIIDALPALTIGVLAIILSSRAEDNVMAKSGKSTLKKRGGRIPLQPQKLVQR